MNKDIAAIRKVLVELEKAEEKHPNFLPWEAGVCLIAEELGELAQAVNDGRLEEAVGEAAHAAVTAIRFISTAMKDMGVEE